jgi:hypothetical protein
MRDRLRRAAPALFGSALLALFFAATLDPRVQLYYRDTGRLYYPVKLFIAQQLRAGHLPFWDPLTESGVSLLGQVTPGLLHPATLLYLAFPFDLAFKLNHMLGPALAGIGTYRLARRLGATSASALAGAITYAGCGYVISVAGSNLPYAMGAGSLPIAVDAVLGFVEAPSARRFAWAGAALALIAYAGEPQALLIAGALSLAWALALGGTARGAARHLALVGCCGALALLLSAPAVLPAFTQLQRSERAEGITAADRSAFANHPARLLGLLVPRAFDDAPEAGSDPTSAWSTYSEYFGSEAAAFSDSIVLGAPALLLAFAGAWAGRRGRLALGGAALLALASAGDALGIDRLLFAAIPLAHLFRFAEKLTAPASLLFALAAALGADAALLGSRRAGVAFAAAAAALAVLAAGTAALLVAKAPAFAGWIVVWGKLHKPDAARELTAALHGGLLDVAALSAVTAAVAAFRSARDRPAAALAPLCCAASVFASNGGLLYSAPVEYVRGPFDLAERLKARAGPSPGRWRLFVNRASPPVLRGLPGRLAVTASAAEALMPQFDATSGIEGAASYFSAGDAFYRAAFTEAPERCFDVFGVRFAVEMPLSFSDAAARVRGFHKAGYGYWVREYPVRGRAFVVGKASRAETLQESVSRFGAASFDVRREAIVRGPAAPPAIEGESSPASLQRLSPERMRVEARGPGLLIVGEHFDPGWRATVNGRAVPVLQGDLAALGVQLPPGPASVDLRFVPAGLVPGIGALIAACAGLSVAMGRRRRR